MSKSISIAELCAEYAMLASERADLDRRIEELGPTTLIDRVASATMLSAADTAARTDMLWMQLEDVLTQQTAVVGALINQVVDDTGGLRDKAQILAKELQDTRSTEAELAQSLCLSLVRDIMTLFPSCAFTATD